MLNHIADKPKLKEVKGIVPCCSFVSVRVIGIGCNGIPDDIAVMIYCCDYLAHVVFLNLPFGFLMVSFFALLSYYIATTMPN